MLEAIISFLPSEGAGSIGSLEYSKSERQKLAKEVRHNVLIPSKCCINSIGHTPYFFFEEEFSFEMYGNRKRAGALTNDT